MWLDTLPPGLTESTTADLLDAVCAIDLSELKTIALIVKSVATWDASARW